MNKDLIHIDILWLRRLVLVAFVLMLFRYLLPPNGFAATVLLFDYEIGLIRRGLMGSLSNLFWGDTVSRGEVVAAAGAMGLFGSFAVLALIQRFLWSSQTGLMLALVMITSFAFGAIVGSTGYMDQVLMGLTALAMLTSGNTWFGLTLRVIVAVVGVFFHEVMLPYFAVLLSVDLWFSRQGVARIWSPAPFLGSVLAFGILVFWAQPSAEDVSTFETYIATKAEFTVSSKNAPDAEVEPEAMAVVGRTLGDNIALMEEKRNAISYRAWLIFDGIPLLMLLGWLMWMNLRVLGPASGLDRLLVAGTLLAPLSLNIIAYDVVRFGAAACLVGFLMMIVQIRNRAPAMDRLRHVLSLPIVLLFLLLGQFVIVSQLSIGTQHHEAVPWVVLQQLEWFR